MKKFKNLVIGGIENKVVNLILLSVILLSAVFLSFLLSQRNELSEASQQATGQLLSSVTETTTTVINTAVVESLGQITAKEAAVSDEMFHDLAVRVQMLGDYARILLENPDDAQQKPWYRPDAAHDGELFVKVLLAEGLEADAVADRLGLIANLSDMMVSLCTAYRADNIFFTLPEGATLMADTLPGNWVNDDGSYVSYNAADRYWYKQAAAEGKLVFSDVEYDHRTGKLCVTCALPVYGADGTLLGVAGADLYLEDMQRTVAESAERGGLLMVLNQQGHVIVSPAQEGIFRVMNSAEAVDLREGDNAALAALVRDALQGQTDVRLVPLDDGNYYMVGVPLDTVGWALVAAYSETLAQQPVAQLQANFTAIQQQVTDAFYAQAARRERIMWISLAVVLVAVLAGSIVLGKRIVKPINAIALRVSELSETDLEFTMEDAYRTGDEVEALAESFAAVSHKAVEHLATIQRVTAEKERISTELSLATQIQSAMLPHIVPAFPDRRDFDVIGTMDPAKEVGGDFYDYFLIDEDHLCMLIADVSGKGVPAALFMMACKIILQSVAMLGKSPSQILAKTNEAICSNNEAGMFVTVWIGILELSTGKLKCASAGHEYPVFKQPGEPFTLYKDRHGLVIGAMNDAKYKEYEVALQPGAKLFVYTDGVPEATNAQQELFGTDRLVEALNRLPDAAPMDVLKNVRSAVDQFVLDAQQFDDLTMLCLEYKG